MQPPRIQSMRRFLVTELGIDPHQLLSRVAGDLANNGFLRGSDGSTIQWGDAFERHVVFPLSFASPYTVVGFDDAGNQLPACKESLTGADFEYSVAWVAWTVPQGE